MNADMYANRTSILRGAARKPNTVKADEFVIESGTVELER
jgi:hypothetical protein